MSVVLFTQILALALGALLAVALVRRLRDTQARRAAAFEDFAEGRGLTLYRIPGTDALYRLTDAAGTLMTVEAAPRTTRNGTKMPGTVSLTLPAPRLSRGFVALVVPGADRPGTRLDQALRGVARGSETPEIRHLGDALAFLSEVPAGESPDLAVLLEALRDPALRPDPGGRAMIALNAEGLHLRLGRTIKDPGALAPILDTLRRLQHRLDAGPRRQAA